MTENSVASIFKILVKIPIIISVSYLIFNIFAFALCYFKVLGASYSLQQIVMENNYLPVNEADAFNKYLRGSSSIDLDGLETVFMDNIYAVVYTDNPVASTSTGRDRDGNVDTDSAVNGVIGNNKRVQYGDTAYVGIVADFHAMWPWSYNELFVNDAGVTGWAGQYDARPQETTFKSASEIENRRQSTAKIDIIHPVIGLQYYSDLE